MKEMLDKVNQIYERQEELIKQYTNTIELQKKEIARLELQIKNQELSQAETQRKLDKLKSALKSLE